MEWVTNIGTIMNKSKTKVLIVSREEINIPIKVEETHI